MHLLDINVLLALADSLHVHHGRSRGWFLSEDVDAWATCPITENGFVRILGHASYPGLEGEAEEARQVLEILVSYPGQQFWSVWKRWKSALLQILPRHPLLLDRFGFSFVGDSQWLHRSPQTTRRVRCRDAGRGF